MNFKKTIWLMTVGFGLLLVLNACGGGGGGRGVTTVSISRFAYVANFNDGTVSSYVVDAATGQLRHNGYVPAGTNPHSVAVHPSGNFVYVSNSRTGTLTRVSTATAGSNPYSVTTTGTIE